MLWIISDGAIYNKELFIEIIVTGFNNENVLACLYIFALIRKRQCVRCKIIPPKEPLKSEWGCKKFSLINNYNKKHWSIQRQKKMFH